MSLTQTVRHGVIVLTALVATQGAKAVVRPDQAVDLMAARLEQQQLKEGVDQGMWVSEEMFTGPMATGMACAYEWTGNATYRASAELAGTYILWIGASVGNLLGDEAYALVRLSEIADDPSENVWRTALQEFYESPRRELTEGTTDEYIAFFGEMDPSMAVFYLAHHAVAAGYADDLDKGIWRDAVIRYLSRVDDYSGFPVMALGAATWSLAMTGPLDETPVARDYEASPYWEDTTVGDLPALLLSHQVPEDDVFAGSFFWRFDHTGGAMEGVNRGYTEDAVFGALGLVAAASQQSDPPSEDTIEAIDAVQEMLLIGIDEDGAVRAHLSRQGQAYNAFAGEMLQALWRIEQYQDGLQDSEDGVDDAVATKE